ncbi:hypothetical protein GGI43DRAFT_167882 [Trichoderma evansii]
MAGILSWRNSLSFPCLSLKARGSGPKKSDEYHHAMPSSLSGPPSPSDRGPRYSSPQLISTSAALSGCGLRPSQIRCAKTRPTSCGQHHCLLQHIVILTTTNQEKQALFLPSPLFPSLLPSLQMVGFTACETLLSPAARFLPFLVSLCLAFLKVGSNLGFLGEESQTRLHSLDCNRLNVQPETLPCKPRSVSFLIPRLHLLNKKDCRRLQNQATC